MPARIEHFLDGAGFDRAPWLAVGFATGIAAWFTLANRWEWLALLAVGPGVALAAMVLMAREGRYPYLRQALIAMALMVSAGCATAWAKSMLIGTPPISHPMAGDMIGRILAREDEPAFGEARLWLATREPRTGRAIEVRVRLPLADDLAGTPMPLREGAVVRLRLRLMPPMPPLVPGARDMAREAWFGGLAATGSVLAPAVVLHPAPDDGWVAGMRRALAQHVLSRVPGSAGGIAATLVSGNRGGISWPDQQAMRDAGLTHLLAISGLHVSAVVGAAYMLTFRLLALWPWLALRVRVPLMATGSGAFAGIFYTVLIGAHLPTVRACLGALLVLAAMAMGRRPLSMRLLAVAAFAVMLIWPESVVDPSFQMSFGSVMAIIALHDGAPVQAFLAHRDEGWWWGVARHVAMLLLGGMVIDLALMPVALYHFHRAGLFGAFANSFAIPLVTFVAMPLIGVALMLDFTGIGLLGFGGATLGGVAWSCVAHSLDLLLAVTHWIVARPGAVALFPAMGGDAYALVVGGMAWIALWHGRARLLGLVPALVAVAMLATLHTPDIIITGDGLNLGLIGADGNGLSLLREGRSAYTRDLLREVEGISTEPTPLTAWPGAACNADFCLIEVARGGRGWRILMARRHAMVPYGAMARACAAADIVIAQDKIYAPCRPSILRADRVVLMRTGGIALDLVVRRIVTVEDGEGEHPWWRAPHHLPPNADDNEPDANTANSTGSDAGVVSANAPDAKAPGR